MKKTFACVDHKFTNLIRSISDIFDTTVLTAAEREGKVNAVALRDFIKNMIKKRRDEMKESTFVDKGDFLTVLLIDELFKGQDDYIVDECLTFMVAATQTTTILTTNALYYLT